MGKSTTGDERPPTEWAGRAACRVRRRGRPRRTRPCRERRIRRRLGGGRRAGARAIAATVDPDGAEPELPGRDVVVVQALGDVEDPVARSIDTFERGLEVAMARLVIADLLRGHDPAKVTPSRRFDAANRSSSRLVMTASLKRRWSEASASAESGKAGQFPHRAGERRNFARRSAPGRGPRRRHGTPWQGCPGTGGTGPPRARPRGRRRPRAAPRSKSLGRGPE